MNILGIETSCDETAVCVVKAEGGTENFNFEVLGDALYSQVAIHEQYGGVFPALAKREHSRNLVPLFIKALDEAGMKKNSKEHENVDEKKIKEILEREPELLTHFLELIIGLERPNIDAIAVTQGPGLEPALWVGINFAKALSELWNIPLIPTNHMEGHIFSVLASGKKTIIFPALTLLISGGHTELVLMSDWQEFQIVGQTRDDAVGEAFDKVARMMNLSYPGGPHISRLATLQREKKSTTTRTTSTSMFTLPRPMIHSKDYDFSFSGLKTSVLYTLRTLPQISDEVKMEMSAEFEQTVTDVLLKKTRGALLEFGAKTLIIGGGVIANTFIKKSFISMIENMTEILLLLPEFEISTDNAIMIAIAGYIKKITTQAGEEDFNSFKAQGNLSFDNKLNLA